MAERTSRSDFRGSPGRDGAGVNLIRTFSHGDVREFDPFLMMDYFNSEDPNDYIRGFPMHPHRGIETITYLVRGEIDHEDSLGNKGAIIDGSCQWMSSGSGILHQEMPQPSDHMLGVQVWLNLPAKRKMSQPTYNDLTRENIPLVEEDNLKIKVLAGNYKGTVGPLVEEDTEPFFYHFESLGQANVSFETDPDYNIYFFVLEGEVEFAGKKYPMASGAVTESGEQMSFQFSGPAHVIVLGGIPLKEPIAWGGPIVMNTQQELNQAFADLRNGTFIQEEGRHVL